MLKILTLTALGLLASIAVAGRTSSSGSVHVRGYFKKDGTYVAPYYRSAPGTASSTTTATPNSQTFSSCAEARAAGRWNILTTDSDYSPSLDRDHDGIACEAGSDGRSNGHDPDNMNTSGSTSYDPPAWAIQGMTYPEWVGYKLAWQSSNESCKDEAQLHEQAFLDDGTGESMAWRSTIGFVSNQPSVQDSENIDQLDAANNIASDVLWDAGQQYISKYVWMKDFPDINYLAEVKPINATSSVVCFSTYVSR